MKLEDNYRGCLLGLAAGDALGATLCLAESLIEREGFDPVDQL
jgi:ADP-ribosylglycohydrolase